VNANTLHNLLRRDTAPYAWLLQMRPYAYAGCSWRLYDLEVDDFARVAASGDPIAGIGHAEALMQTGRHAEAWRLYAKMGATGPPEVYVSAIRAGLEENDVDVAGEWVRRGLERHPSSEHIRTWAARVQLEAALARNSSNARAAFELGLWWASRAEVERALPWLQQAAATRPEDAEIVRELGIALLHLERFDDAIAVFSRPSLRGALSAELGATRRLARSEALLESDSAARAQLDRPALLELATTHFGNRRYDRAAAALVEMLRRDPADGAALALLSEMQVRVKLRIVPDPLTPRRVTREG
jgi:tetratricopeptide (TPR) repeat protein